MNIEKIMNELSQLDYVKQQEYADLLSQFVIQSRPVLNHKTKPTSCPHCNHEKIHKHGSYKITNGGKTKKTGGTRYKCQGCKRTFNELTGTSIHAVKKTKEFRDFIEQMFLGKSLIKTSEAINVSPKTVFRWRHQVLSSFENIFTKEFKGIVETDDIFFRLNQKGRRKNFVHTGKPRQGVSNKKHVSVMITLDRYKTFDFKLVCTGKINSTHLKREIDISRFNNENIICSDKSRALIKFFKEVGLKHMTFKSEDKRHPKLNEYHVNTLNNRVGRLKKWISDNFSSVSTKYMNHYLRYYMMLEILKNDDNMKQKWWDFMLQDTDTFNRNRKTEKDYVKLLGHSGIRFQTPKITTTQCSQV